MAYGDQKCKAVGDGGFPVGIKARELFAGYAEESCPVQDSPGGDGAGDGVTSCQDALADCRARRFFFNARAGRDFSVCDDIGSFVAAPRRPRRRLVPARPGPVPVPQRDHRADQRYRPDAVLVQGHEGRRARAAGLL